MKTIVKVKREKVRGNRADSGHDEFTQQDTAGRRLVRSEYLTIMNSIREKRDDISSADSEKFRSIMSEVEDLHQLVEKPREQVADAEALLNLAKTLLASVKSHASEGVTPTDFISCLLRNFTKTQGRRGTSEAAPNSILWKEIGFAVSPIFKNFRGCCTMLGPMQTQLKKRKVAVYRKRAKPTQSSRPEELGSSGADVRADTDKNMATMFEILKMKKSVKLENLILNRKSFAQTVENLFALSFLVKDGRVEMAVDEKGSHLVSPRNAPAAYSVMSGEVTYSHFVIRYDFSDWKLMKDYLCVEEELMPHRECGNISSSKSNSAPNGSQAPFCSTTPVKIILRNVVWPVVVQDSLEIGDVKRKLL